VYTEQHSPAAAPGESRAKHARLNAIRPSHQRETQQAESAQLTPTTPVDRWSKTYRPRTTHDNRRSAGAYQPSRTNWGPSAPSQNKQHTSVTVSISTIKTPRTLTVREQTPRKLGSAAQPVTAVHAMDVTLQVATCQAIKRTQVDAEVWFRSKTAAIKGHSLLELDQLVLIYRDCPKSARIVVSHNARQKREATDTLRQRRQDEIKYYLLQHGVAQSDVSYAQP